MNTIMNLKSQVEELRKLKDFYESRHQELEDKVKKLTPEPVSQLKEEANISSKGIGKRCFATTLLLT